MKLLHRFSVAAATVALCAFSLPTLALTLSSGSPSGSFTWSFDAGGTVGTLSGSGSLSVTGFNSTTLTVVVSLTNNADSTERLTAFAFGIEPDATGVDFSDNDTTGMTDADFGDIPSIKSVEVCSFSGPNCQGGAGDGIFGGTSDTFTLILTGTWGDTVIFDPLAFKYQTGAGSFEFTASSSSSSSGAGESSTSSSSSGTPVPEPSSSLVLLGLGLLGLGYARRMKRTS